MVMEESVKKPARIGLVQINNSFSGANYFPYSVGLLQGYAVANAVDPSAYEFMPPIYKRSRIDEVVERLLDADVVGFSAYVWNERISLEIARRLKSRNPDVLIVFGGPQVPDNSEPFLRDNDFVDVACHGEGEETFLKILEGHSGTGWSDVAGLSYLSGGEFHNNPKGSRIADLDEIPSPYLSGVFTALIRNNPEEEWLGLWETNRGCPFSCTFCDWGSAVASKVYRFGLERLKSEMEWFAELKTEFVFCCDANFGILPRDVELAEYAASVKERTGYPHALSVQNTKNATDRAYQVQKTLSDSGLNKGVTLSMQSVDEATLSSIKRTNISLDTYSELQRRFTRDRVETYSDVILALPGETYDAYANGVASIIANGQHNRIQFNNLSILPNAEMGNPDYQRQFGMISVETKIVNVHGRLVDPEREVDEMQRLVVATDAMPKDQWIRARAFSWLSALLYFDKVLQIPLLLLGQICKISFREIMELFATADRSQYPTLVEVHDLFLDKARDIQNGGEEYCESRQWLEIWWPADELAFINLCHEEKLPIFYEESRKIIEGFVDDRGLDVPRQLLADAHRLNLAMLKQPMVDGNDSVACSYNVLECYNSALFGEAVEPREGQFEYEIRREEERWSSWQDWCRDVVWYGNKKGAYLYQAAVAEDAGKPVGATSSS
jgi:hypothetical protein